MGFDLSDLDLWPLIFAYCMDITFVKSNNSWIQKYTVSIRQCNYLRIPIIQSDLAKTNIRYRGSVIRNHIISCGIDPDIAEAVFVKFVNFFLPMICSICKIFKCGFMACSESFAILSYIKSLYDLVSVMTCLQRYIFTNLHASLITPLTIND